MYIGVNLIDVKVMVFIVFNEVFYVIGFWEIVLSYVMF